MIQLPVSKQLELLNTKFETLMGALTDKITRLENKINASQLPLQETNEEKIIRAQADIERAKAVLQGIINGETNT